MKEFALLINSCKIATMIKEVDKKGQLKLFVSKSKKNVN